MADIFLDQMLKKELFNTRIRLYILYVKNKIIQYLVVKNDVKNGGL